MNKRDHPTAEEIYARARRQMPSISLAHPLLSQPHPTRPFLLQGYRRGHRHRIKRKHLVRTQSRPATRLPRRAHRHRL
ncbi:MAG: hypothetical protein ACPF9Q_02235 [Opitutales bacterium]